MAETYCTKSCAECAKRESAQCPGCKTGPGRAIGGECGIANCCRGKGHETCETCGFRSSCGMLAGRDDMMEKLTRDRENRAQERENIARRAVVLGKWLWPLFWLVIPNLISSILTQEDLAAAVPEIGMVGEVLGAVCTIAYAVILLQMRREEEGYGTAGKLLLGSFVLSAVTTLLGDNILAAVAGLAASIVSLLGEYQEFTAHADVLSGVDSELSEKWRRLWTWNVAAMIAMLVAIPVTLIVPVVGMIVLLAAAIGAIAVGVLKLVYLYRMAKLFREYPQ